MAIIIIVVVVVVVIIVGVIIIIVVVVVIIIVIISSIAHQGRARNVIMAPQGGQTDRQACYYCPPRPRQQCYYCPQGRQWAEVDRQTDIP